MESRTGLSIDMRRRLRQQVQVDVDRFFKRPITVGERAFRHIELSCEVMPLNHRKCNIGDAFLSRSLQGYPALQAAFSRIGIRESMFEDTSLRPGQYSLKRLSETPLDYALEKSFFHDGYRENGLVPSAQRIAETGELRMEDLLIGPLESGNTNWGITRRIVDSLISAIRSVDASSNEHDRNKLFAEVVNELQFVREFDAACNDQQFILSFDSRVYRLQPFGVWTADDLSESPLPDGSRWIARGNVLQPLTARSRFTVAAVSELEDLINKCAKEQDFQSFFEKNPEFLLSLGPYARLHPQIVLAEDTGSRLIPDFFLEKLNSSFVDICDLKRPTAELVRYQRHRDRFRDAVMEAVAQLDYYRDWFEDPRHRKAFHSKYGLQSYRPTVVVIIGRRSSFYDEVERLRLESRLPAWVRLNTYDDVVERARQWFAFTEGKEC